MVRAATFRFRPARILPGLSLALLSLPHLALPAAGQSDTIVVRAGERYEADPLQERLLGRGYRDLWTLPVRVPVLDLGTFAGGLTPVERGGGMQTRSLRFRTASGQEFNFRSVDKDVGRGLPPDVRGTVVEDVLQDQVAALHPAAAVIATGLLDAVGIPNPGPRLVVLPDDPRLGEFREEFAGTLGTIELHVNEADDNRFPDFAGADEVEGTEDFFREIRESPEDRVDARAVLASRLVSLLLADWDRHAGQFRWARFEGDGADRWIPVPEDRDYALADYDGLLVGLAGFLFPEAAPFEPAYRRNLYGLLENAAEVDRRLLAGLDREDWEAVVERLQADLTDEAIEAAVRRQPPEYFERSGPELIRILRERRDRLDEAAERFYGLLAREPEIHASDVAERAEVLRLPGGGVRVTLRAAGDSLPYFERTFLPGETREIRLRLHGGDDVAEVRGRSREGILVRVIGGEGADTLVNRSRVEGVGIRTAFYAADGEDEIAAVAPTVVDRTPYAEPVWIPGEVRPPRDWGASFSWFSPWVGYEGTEGLIVGGGPAYTWYGFRRYPYAGRVRLRAMYGIGSGELGVDAEGEFPGVGAAPGVRLHARASALEAFRFHGFGNDSPREVESPVVRYEQRLFEARLVWAPAPGISAGAGPVFEHIGPDDRSAPPAVRSYGKAGLAGGFAISGRPDRGPLDGGFALETEGAAFPDAWDLEEPFGRLRGEVAGSLPLGARAAAAARFGGGWLWGDPPLPEALFLGGSGTVRGFPFQRFAGDGLIYGGAEFRRHLARVRLVVNGDLGLLTFADAGRVFYEGESDGGWHVGYGAGVWFEALDRVVALSWARGERDVAYLRLGMPF